MVKLFGELISRWKPEICVIACNTASTIGIAALRKAYPDQEFVGTVPAIKPAAERTSSGMVSVLATPGTVKRQYTRDLIEQYASKCHVTLVGSTKLAACTHYPFLANRMRKMAPWPVDWIDTSEAIARRAADLLKDNTLSENGDFQHGEDIAYFTSGSQNAETLQLLAGFGLKPA